MQSLQVSQAIDTDASQPFGSRPSCSPSGLWSKLLPIRSSKCVLEDFLSVLELVLLPWYVVPLHNPHNATVTRLTHGIDRAFVHRRNFTQQIPRTHDLHRHDLSRDRLRPRLRVRRRFLPRPLRLALHGRPRRHPIDRAGRLPLLLSRVASPAHVPQQRGGVHKRDPQDLPPGDRRASGAESSLHHDGSQPSKVFERGDLDPEVPIHDG